MRVLFDGFWWRDGPPSGRNVLTSIVSEWRSRFPDDELALAVPRSVAESAAVDIPNGVLPLVSALPQHAVSTTLELSRHRGFDVVFSQNFTPLFSGALRATFVHDVIFQAHPEWFTRAERLYLSAVPRLAWRADLVFTSSSSEAARIGRLNPALRDRTTAVGLGLAHSFSTAVPSRPDLPVAPGEFLLAVGRINERKNLERLVIALLERGSIGAAFPLVVVGAGDGFSGAMPALVAARDSGTVLQPGYLSNEHLRWLYANCASFAFPSLDEGFGLPVLEAAASGAPMALSSIPAFEEFGAVGSFFDPLDLGSIADGVAASMAAGPMAAAALLGEQYSWAATVSRIRHTIEERL